MTTIDGLAAWCRRAVGCLGAALLASMAMVVVTAAPAAPQSAPQGPREVGVVAFEPAPPIDPGQLSPLALAKLRHAHRSRFVDAPAVGAAADGVSSTLGAPRVDIELFPDVVAALDSVGEGLVAGQEGSTTWSGRSPDGDYATLTFIDGKTIGTAAVAGVVYDIAPVPGGRLLITEEGRDFPAEAEPLVAGDHADGKAADPVTPGPVTPTMPPAPTDAGPVVDVLTWYDTAAHAYYGDDAAAVADLTATINEVNAAYVRSGVNQSLRSVGIEYVSYAGTGAASTEIGRWQSPSDGFLDGVHSRREQTSADLAALISPLSDACGIGYLGGPASGEYGFSVVDPGCARGNLSYAHELGHNMGAGHGDPDGGGLFSYSNGYRDLVNDFRTIMAYDSASCPGGSCPRVAFFSGPTALYNGHPTGSAVHDNARTISERAAVTAAYRSPPTGVSGTVTGSGSGSPVAGAMVALLRTTDFSIAGGAAADAGGSFSATVAPGSYFVYALDPTGAHTAGFFGAPTTVVVTAGGLTDADPVLSPLRGSVSATVTDAGSGIPIAGAWGLSLSTGAANTGATEVAVVANAAGALSLPGLRPGTHFVGFVDPTGAHATRFYPNSPNVPASTAVAVTAGNATVASTSLPAQAAVATGASLSGTITEEGTGAPMAGAMVVALQAADYKMVRGAVTDGAGAYHLSVAAGAYKLAVFDSTGRHAMEWFDNRPSTGLADAASVTAPAVADAALAPNTGTLAGMITDDPSGAALGGAWVIAIGPAGIAGGAVTASDGSYTIAGLAPGTYRATAVDPVGGRAQEYFDDSPDFGGATPFNITAGTTATVNAALAQAPPPNDAFANAQVLSGANGTVAGANAGATKESGEPNHGGQAGGGSIWYRWTAPATGTATVTTCGSDFDTLLGAYTGTAVNGLTTLSGNDDACGVQSAVSFGATAGVTYRVAVDGYANTRGQVALDWSIATGGPSAGSAGPG